MDKLNDEDINIKLGKIMRTIEVLETTIDKIQKKIVEINEMYMRFKFNKTLSLDKTNTYLKFQVDLLQTEKKYYTSIKNVILKKLFTEIYEIAEYSLLILISLNDIDIENELAKKNIMRKITKIKRYSKITTEKVIELINCAIKNLKLINDFLNLIEKYINEVLKQNKQKNIHTKNFKISIMNRKNHILLEYTKHCDQMTELIDYFLGCSNSIIKQLEKQELFKFFIEEKKQDLNIKIL